MCANPFAALAEGRILQVIFFAGLLGFALVKLGDKAARLRELAGEASDAMIQVTRFVLEMTPLGTFGLIAALVGSYGFERLLPLGWFVLTIFVACAVHIVVVYGGLLLAHGLNPLRFFKGAAGAMQVAFATSSSHLQRRRVLPRCPQPCAPSATTWASIVTTSRSLCRLGRASRWMVVGRSIRRSLRCLWRSTSRSI